VLLNLPRLQHTFCTTSVCVYDQSLPDISLHPHTSIIHPLLRLFSRAGPNTQQPSLARTSRRVVMSQQHHQQLEGDSTIIGSFPNPRSSDDEMSSINNEKTLDAEAGLQPQKPPGGGPPGGPPPNGGLTAWLQVLGGFFLFFNTWVSMFGSLHSWCTVCLMF
jgi:hypothetical protein